MKRILIGLLLASLFLAGCATSTPAPTPTATPTALQSFEAVVEANAHLVFTEKSPGYAQYCATILSVDVSYDVEATSSLVSPYVGTITYSVQDNFSGTPLNGTLVDTYALQSGGWVFKDSQGNVPAVENGYCVLSKVALQP